MRRLGAVVLLFGALLVGATPAAEPMPPLVGYTLIHDPSVLWTLQGWVAFGTGGENTSDGGVPNVRISSDGLAWRDRGALPGAQPGWIAAELGTTPRNLWAPSISAHGGVTFLYYAGSSFGKNDSAIGLMTNEAFNPTHPTQGWVDRGLVLRSHAGDNFNAIDPFRIDSGDTAWLAFGSFWDGIRLVEIDPLSGLLKDGAEPIRIASRGGGAIEAPAILAHDGHFYLFVSFDACCRGISSTYRIMVGRADAVTGPYLDRDGRALLEGGGTEVLAGPGRFRGPGGQATFLVDGAPWLAFHYYDKAQGGTPKLQLAPLGWTDDGWPELGPLPQ